MHLTILLTIWIIRQVYASSQNKDQQCQLLARELNINDVTTVDSLQKSCTDIKDYNATQRTHLACAFAAATSSHESSSADHFAGYIGPLSPYFSNRTTANWYVIDRPALLGFRGC